MPRRKRAEEEKWLGESKGIDLLLTFVRAKILSYVVSLISRLWHVMTAARS